MAKTAVALCHLVVGTGRIVLCVWLVAFARLGHSCGHGTFDRAFVQLFDRFIRLCGFGEWYLALIDGDIADNHQWGVWGVVFTKAVINEKVNKFL